LSTWSEIKKKKGYIPLQMIWLTISIYYFWNKENNSGTSSFFS